MVTIEAFIKCPGKVIEGVINSALMVWEISERKPKNMVIFEQSLEIRIWSVTESFLCLNDQLSSWFLKERI